MVGGTHEHPAVVLGLNPTGLGLVRSLAPHCSNLIALESDRAEPGTRTQLCEVKMISDMLDSDRLLDELVALSRRFCERPVLLLSTDQQVLWAAKERSKLETYCRLLLPPAPVCEALMFKDSLLALAAREGWPVPAGAFLPVDGLAAAIEKAGLQYPVILKPTLKTAAWQEAALNKAYIVRDADEAHAMAARARGVVTDLLAQEYLEGDDGQVFFCLYLAAPGMEPLTFCGRKLLQWPPLRGSTAACEPVAAPDLELVTRSLFGKLGVEGFASLEVKYGGDGKFKIIEPTIGRVDLQSQVATLNGMNMPLVAYLASLGRLEEAQAFAHPSRDDVAWLYESSLLSLLRTGALRLETLFDLVRREKGYAFASWSDPRVLMALTGQLMKMAAHKARLLAPI
jgi:D-aspartate ligase